MNISLIQRTERVDKSGKSPIRIRTINKKKVNYYSTGISVTTDQWNGKEVVDHPNAKSLNSLLRSKFSDFEKRYIESAIADVEFNPSKEARKNFHEYWDKKITALEKKLGRSKVKYKRSYLKKLQDFKPVLYFSQITPDLMYQYEQYCRDKGNNENTVWGAVKFVKSMVNIALKEGVIKVNPLAGYKSPKYKNPKRDFLTEDEVNRLEDFATGEHHQTLINTANWFLFACYSFLRYGDCVRFDRRKHIINGKIIMRTEKAGSDVSIKIHPRLQKVLDRLTDQIYSNFRVNHYLKIISIQMELGKDLHFHLARHTASILFLSRGGSMEALSKLLSHSTIRVTEIYGKIQDERVDAEVEKVWG